ncbi:MAG: hypothetical protein C7B46_19945 [Sulfobacillus benefaciens]|uniref:DUF3137 domain-containing protein n=1 Tax=Sulfobacillus benefaciens TaxID=453960 RepID=A0A2T2WW80_9FIRM|nr:MAG: hypothetical protein C7B46_19945 [Sulfobacillus benefaciens]
MWSSFVYLGIIVVVMIVSGLTNAHPSLLTYLGLISGPLVIIITTVYRKDERAYWLAHRLLGRWRNVPARWDIKLRLKTITPVTLETLSHQSMQFLREAGTHPETMQEGGSRIVTRMAPFVVTWIDEGDNAYLFQLENIFGTVRQSLKILDNALAPLLEDLRYSMAVDPLDIWLQVHFEQRNPYFGLFATKLDASQVDRFNLVFHREEGEISVRKRDIEIHTLSLHGLRRLAAHYLTLIGPLA